MILSVQYLRAVAAMMVVAFHAADLLARHTGGQPPFPFTIGPAGVDIFFVISGFIIQQTTAGRDIRPLAFMARRIARIVPLYWLLTLVVANIAILRPDLIQSTMFQGGHFLASMFFVPAYHPGAHVVMPLLIPGWTLNYEMAFYLLFAVSLLLPARLRMPAILAVLVFAVSLRGILPESAAATFYTRPQILEFGAGILIAAAYGAGKRLPAWLAAALLASGFIGLLMLTGRAVDGISAALIVTGAVFFDARRPVGRNAALLLLGDASYAIYLSHVLALPIFGKIWSGIGLGVDGAAGGAFIGCAILVSAIAGVATHLLVEKPLGLVFRRPRSKPLQSSTLPHAGAAIA